MTQVIPSTTKGKDLSWLSQTVFPTQFFAPVTIRYREVLLCGGWGVVGIFLPYNSPPQSSFFSVKKDWCGVV